MMDNVPGSPQAGALPPRERGNSVGFKCFREVPAVPFCLAHCCFLKTGLVHFDGDGIIRGNSALCY